MNFPPAMIRRALDWIDAKQQRFGPSAFAVAVIKRNGDRRGSMFAALVTFYGLLSVFPLLLLFITFASMILGANSEATTRLINAALADFPVIGDEIAKNIHALAKGNAFALIASALFLLWGALGLTSALQTASHQAWSRPRHEEPNILVRTLRGLSLLGVIGLSVGAATVLTGISQAGIFHTSPLVIRLLVLLGTAVVDLVAYYVAMRILSPKEVTGRQLIPGIMVGGLGWLALQNLGGYLIQHQLHRTTAIYGFFAIVLGLIFWLNLGAQLFMYATQINVVRVNRAWPRGLFEPSDEVKAELAENGQSFEN